MVWPGGVKFYHWFSFDIFIWSIFIIEPAAGTGWGEGASAKGWASPTDAQAGSPKAAAGSGWGESEPSKGWASPTNAEPGSPKGDEGGWGSVPESSWDAPVESKSETKSWSRQSSIERKDDTQKKAPWAMGEQAPLVAPSAYFRKGRYIYFL